LNWVPRPQLIERLTQGLTCKLTLISAPASFGKTTLVGEWHTSPTGQVPLAWLSLDDNDNDPARFLTYLIAAL
jgi:LuxR family maltose regulon positive regulatory protein